MKKAYYWLMALSLLFLVTYLLVSGSALDDIISYSILLVTVVQSLDELNHIWHKVTAQFPYNVIRGGKPPYLGSWESLLWFAYEAKSSHWSSTIWLSEYIHLVVDTFVVLTLFLVKMELHGVRAGILGFAMDTFTKILVFVFFEVLELHTIVGVLGLFTSMNIFRGQLKIINMLRNRKISSSASLCFKNSILQFVSNALWLIYGCITHDAFVLVRCGCGAAWEIKLFYAHEKLQQD